MSFRLRGEEKQEKTSRYSSIFGDPAKLESLSEDTDSTAAVRERLQSKLPQGENYFQRCVIVQKDEYGYGLTVSGENPVYVDSIKPGGAAQQAGVREGDMIVKVNGNLVAKANHKEVVKLIKSGTYVSLTLLSRQARVQDDSVLPNTPSTGSLTCTSPISIPSIVDRPPMMSSPSLDFITGPQPVNSEKNLEFNRQKLDTIRVMYQQAKMDYNRLKNEYELQPTDKLHTQLQDKAKIVRNLEEQIRGLDPVVQGQGHGHKRSQSDLTGIKTEVHRNQEDSDQEESESMTTSESASSLASPPALDETDNALSPTSMAMPLHSPLQPKTPTMGGADPLNIRLGSSPPRSLGIITMEDDEFESEDEHQFDNHGHFTSIQRLMKHPAHLSVFLSYLISNHDPAPVFFYIISDSYSHGNMKEMRKWAYEIHSTFINEKAPLHLSLHEDLVSCVENVLVAKYEREDSLRTIFDDIRSLIKAQISKSLQDYCNTRALGLGSMYGDHELLELDATDKSSITRFIDKQLSPHLETFLERDEVSDRNLALALCIGSFMKSVGVPRTASNQRLLDRTSSFNEKDKRMFKFPKGVRKTHSVNNHSLEAQHYFCSTYCSPCGGILWGVGYQGFQCTTCDQNFHKHCLETLKESCPGQSMYKAKKDKTKRTSVLDKIITRKPSNNSPTAIREAQMNYDQGLVSPSGAPGFHLQDTVPEGTEPEDRGGPSRVGKLVDRYQKMNKDDKPQEESPPSSDKEKRSSPVGRSESMKGRQKERVSSGSVRRTKSDVTNDDGSVMKAISDQAVASSSSSSLSTKSASPSMSIEHVNRMVQIDSDFEVENDLPSLDTVLSKETLKKLKPKEKKRQDVINELFYTERSHLRNLKILDQVFYQPWISDSTLPKKLVNQLLPNIEDLIRLHSTINRAMKIARPKEGKAFGDIADIMLDYFSGEKGEQFKKACALYCRNHRYALDQLKAKLKKDQKLVQFLQEAEANPLCRRLKLTDLIPMQMQRLTKYRLLVENMLKYTPVNSGEHKRLQKVLLESKNILAEVNQAVTDCENAHKLENLQKRMEKRPEINNDNQAKNLNLNEHKLLYDGTLMLKDGKSKITECHVVLLEDILVVLQKQDEKLILKPLSIKTMGPVRPDDSVKFSSPVIPLVGLLTRNVATDKKAFFLVSISGDSRIFELIAGTVDEREKWYKHISAASEAACKTSPGGILRLPLPKPEAEPRAPVQNEEKDVNEEEEETEDKIDTRFEEPENTDLPSPREVLRRTDHIIANALQEKQRVIAEMMGMPAGEFENIAELASALGDEKEPHELIVAAILQTNRLTTLAKDTLKPPAKGEEDSEKVEEKGEGSEKGEAEATPSPASTVHLPVGVLLEIVTSLNQDLTQLLRITREREMEADKLRQELKTAQEHMKILQDVSMVSQSPGNSRPASFISVGSELSEESSDEPVNDACSTPKPGSFHTPRDSLSSNVDEDGQVTPLVQDEQPSFDLTVDTEHAGTPSENVREGADDTKTGDVDDHTEVVYDNTEDGDSMSRLEVEEYEVERGESDTSMERIEFENPDIMESRTEEDDGRKESVDVTSDCEVFTEVHDAPTTEMTEKSESGVTVSKTELDIGDSEHHEVFDSVNESTDHGENIDLVAMETDVAKDDEDVAKHDEDVVKDDGTVSEVRDVTDHPGESGDGDGVAMGIVAKVDDDDDEEIHVVDDYYYDEADKNPSSSEVH